MASKVESDGICGMVAKTWLRFTKLPPPTPPALPNEIIYDILLLLPVKSLARCRCVCREWNNLLTGSDFIKKHLDYGHHRLIVSFSKSHMSIDLEEASNFVVTNHEFPWKEHVHEIVGSCNGLLCIGLGHHHFLWNPSTRKYKQLPPHSSCFSKYNTIFYGFGYDMSIDGCYNYKVVRGERYINIGYDMRRSKVEIYTGKTDSWKRIQDIPCNINVFQERGVFVNGLLHWLADCGSGKIIASLNLAKEEFGEIMVPDFEKQSLLVELGVLNGMLCVMYHNFRAWQSTWDIYAMKEYGVPDSWIQLITTPSFFGTRTMPTMPFEWTATINMPLYLMKNGELVLETTQSNILMYNPRRERLKKLIDTKFESKSIIYVESLESP
ncbi:F-box protein CPR1-like [Cornus florida]|uniref:F-box protein CPR1-like n=1 Tax=Cornus florida TaxID=4283 RepID=UPI002899E5D7|nr:F-box protein CPR1-like [Cornus florida]